MKKISRYVTLFVLLASFSTPLFVLAACPIGYIVDLSNSAYCVSSSNPLDRIANTPSSSSGSVNETYLRFYYDLVLTVVNSYFVPILIAIAFIVFLWGIFKAFIWNAASESEKAEGRKFVMWGIIGLVIITSVWGLVNIVKDTIVPTAKSTAPAYPRL